jgi:hypothetical protein
MTQGCSQCLPSGVPWAPLQLSESLCVWLCGRCPCSPAWRALSPPPPCEAQTRPWLLQHWALHPCKLCRHPKPSPSLVFLPSLHLWCLLPLVPFERLALPKPRGGA